MIFVFRGFADKDKQAFRQHYSQLADIRALLPTGVPLMALTATATLQTRNDVMKNLAMTQVHVVQESPNRPNIKLSTVQCAKKDYEGIFSWLIDEVNGGLIDSLIDRRID